MGRGAGGYGWGPKGRLHPHVNSRQLQMLCVTVSFMPNMAPFARLSFSVSVYKCECECVCLCVCADMCVIYYAAESGNSGQ